MSQFETIRLHSKNEVIEVLERLLAEKDPDPENSSKLQREWRVISTCAFDKMSALGREGWDFVLMEWPADVPLFDVTIHNSRISPSLPVEYLHELVSALDLPWIVRVEHIDRIQNGMMVGGEDLRDTLVLKDKVYDWKATSEVKPPGD